MIRSKHEFFAAALAVGLARAAEVGEAEDRQAAAMLCGHLSDMIREGAGGLPPAARNSGMPAGFRHARLHSEDGGRDTLFRQDDRPIDVADLAYSIREIVLEAGGHVCAVALLPTVDRGVLELAIV